MIDYLEKAIRTAPLGLRDRYEVAIRLDSHRSQDLIHALLGILTEAGELADPIKKYLYYGKPTDRTNFIEELGDLLWYIALACHAMDVDLDTVMEKNIAKLKARYPEKFSAEAAIHRDLDHERHTLEE